MKKRYIIASFVTALILYAAHHLWLGFKDCKNFDFMLFIIILTIGYLGSLKLTSYLADFKTLQHKSRIEIVFLVIFFTMLFIPMSNINQDEMLETENRTLEKWHPLITEKGTLNYNFGKDFEKWFNDRFYTRQFFININVLRKYHTEQILDFPKAYFIKETNWIFNKAQHPEKINVTDDIIKNAAKNLNKFNEFCKKNNIKLYVLIVPYTQNIYYEYSNNKNPKSIEQMNKNIEKLIQISDMPVIYPYDKLLANRKKDFVYYKTDHHWTDIGAYIGYEELINVIKKDYPQLKPIGKDKFDITTSRKVRSCEIDRIFYSGNTLHFFANTLEIYSEQILDTDYKYYELKDKNNLAIETIKQPYFGRNYYYPKGYDIKVLETGSSMNENLLTFTAPTFKSLKYIRLNTKQKESEQFKILKYSKKEILEYKPDIMILCITPLNFKIINKLIKED